MKVQIVLPLSLIVSIALLGFLKVLKKEELKQEKRTRFHEIKVRVSADVLQEYQREQAQTEQRIRKAEEELKTLEEQVNTATEKHDKAKRDTLICTAERKTQLDELAAEESVVNKLKGELSKESSSWKTEQETLKQQLEKRSAVCNYLKEDPGPARTLCGGEAQKKEPKAEEPKAEQPKKEEPKAEEPKKEEPKPGEPKKEEPKPEEPKKEEPKPEEPKKEEPKPGEPKKEEPKPEEPKKEEPKPEEPKKEEPKPGEPKKEEPKAEEPKKE